MKRAEAARGISVVIPARNVGALLVEQLEALAVADPPPAGFEIIVSDNGSSDDTVAVAEGFASRLCVRVVDSGAKLGINYARNCGIRAARHQRILLCDGDDQVDAGWLNAMTRAFDDGHKLLAGPIDYRRLNPAYVRRWRGAEKSSTGQIMNFLRSGHGANLGFSKDLWAELSGFDESYLFGGDDVDFCWRAQFHGTQLTTVPDAVVHYRLRDSLSTLYSQSRGYGAAEARLYKDFASSGLRRRPMRMLIHDTWWLLTRLPFALAPGRRGAWVRRAGQQVGRFEGAIRQRVLWW